jgi:hypothetical protein
MKIKKILSMLSLVAVLTIPLYLQASVKDTHICIGSGEKCMEVDIGKGMIAVFVKKPGSAAVVMED